MKRDGVREKARKINDGKEKGTISQTEHLGKREQSGTEMNKGGKEQKNIRTMKGVGGHSVYKRQLL